MARSNSLIAAESDDMVFVPVDWYLAATSISGWTADTPPTGETATLTLVTAPESSPAPVIAVLGLALLMGMTTVPAWIRFRRDRAAQLIPPAG